MFPLQRITGMASTTTFNIHQGLTSLEVQYPNLIDTVVTGIDSNDMQDSPVQSPKCSLMYRSESSPKTPVKSKCFRGGPRSVFLDETSTDSGDLSTTNTDESDEGEESVTPTSRNSSRIYARDALLLLRVAVGISARPSVSWGTECRNTRAENASSKQPQSPAGSNTEADDELSLWRRGLSAQQQQQQQQPRLPRGSNGRQQQKLEVSANSWVSQQRRIHDSISSDAEVVRSIKSILNKLTIEKFDALYAKLLACGVSKPEHVQILVSEVFDKATAQHHFIEMYADLCMRLDRDLSGHEAMASCQGGFRKILLEQCQSKFEQTLAPPSFSDESMDAEAIMEAADRHKQCVIGNIQLVGTLLVRGMLSSRILFACAQELLRDPSLPQALETLATFLRVVGPKFDNKAWSHHAQLSSIFDRVDEITRDKTVPPRLRFLLRDVLDLRIASWVDTKKATKKTEGPMKLEEVSRKVASEEAAQIQTPQQSSKKSNQKQDRQPQKDKGQPKKQLPSSTERQSPKVTASQKPIAPSKPATPAPWAHLTLKNKETKSPPSSGAQALQKGSSATEVVSGPSVGVEVPVATAPQPSTNGPFDLKAYRREMSAIIRELGTTRDTIAAVRRVREQDLPVKHHAVEFMNLLTRIAEERCGAARRASFAFAATLAGSVFDKEQCIQGTSVFFAEVYEDLCEEVVRLPAVLKGELVPTLQAALGEEKLNELLPPGLK